MRVEATIPETRGHAVAELAAELGLSRSQVVDEALALFLKAVVEVRRGRRLVTVDPHHDAPVCELATPTLSALEWVTSRQRIALAPDEIEAMHAALEAPPQPSAALKSAAKRHRR